MKTRTKSLFKPKNVSIMVVNLVGQPW